MSYATQNRLPAPPAPTLGWITAAIAAAQGANQLYQTYAKESGGSCWTGFNKNLGDPPCADTPNMDAVVRAVQKAPDAEINAILAVLAATNSGRGPKSRADLLRPECVWAWVRAMMGGGDCRASKVPEQPQMLHNLVEKYGAPENPWQELPGSALQGLKKSTNLAPLVAGGLALVFFPKLF